MAQKNPNMQNWITSTAMWLNKYILIFSCAAYYHCALKFQNLRRALFYQDTEKRAPRRTGFYDITAGILAEADEEKRVVRSQKLAARASRNEKPDSTASANDEGQESVAGGSQDGIGVTNGDVGGTPPPIVDKGKGVLRDDDIAQDVEMDPMEGELGIDEGITLGRRGQPRSASSFNTP